VSAESKCPVEIFVWESSPKIVFTPKKELESVAKQA